MTPNTETSPAQSNEQLVARAQRVIPGGVNSPVRAFKAVGGTPRFVKRAQGAYFWDAAGQRYPHVPRNEAVRRTLRPVYTKHPGWTEDVSQVRKFADLPRNAQLYVAAMVRSLVDVAYGTGARPSTLPNLRYLGVGPEPSQIIKDVPATAELIRLT